MRFKAYSLLKGFWSLGRHEMRNGSVGIEVPWLLGGQVFAPQLCPKPLALKLGMFPFFHSQSLTGIRIGVL